MVKIPVFFMLTFCQKRLKSPEKGVILGAIRKRRENFNRYGK